VTAPERKPSLEGRFTRFVEALPNAETIDKLQLPPDPSRRRKADFLLGNREVIVELKTLTDDTSHKVDAVADKHREREDFPLFYGKADVRKVLSHLPDGEDIYRRMVWSLTRSVEDCVRSAEEQITHTRSVLGLPHAAGLLVILNESVRILTPGPGGAPGRAAHAPGAHRQLRCREGRLRLAALREPCATDGERATDHDKHADTWRADRIHAVVYRVPPAHGGALGVG
jgi:hypothetical protein